MTQLFAQPYSTAGSGFYFKSANEFDNHLATLRHAYGEAFQEFEIQFIDGDRIDCEFANAFELNQSNFAKFFELVDNWDVHEKTRFIVANGECGYGFNPDTDNINDLDIDIYDVQSLKELAEQFIDEGLYGEIPKSLEFYIDYDAIARDLSVDYSMTTVSGERFAYRCG